MGKTAPGCAVLADRLALTTVRFVTKGVGLAVLGPSWMQPSWWASL